MSVQPTPLPAPTASPMAPVVLRFGHKVERSLDLLSRLEALGSGVEIASPGALLQAETDRVRRPRYLLAGWACRFRELKDGRRQIFSLVLPGEGVGVSLHSTPFVRTSTQALTPVQLADATPLLQPDVLAAHSELRRLLHEQVELIERQALDHIVRLGRMSACERLGHVFLDLRDRLDVVGQVRDDRFPTPLTQHVLADLVGLSVVHVNRTLKELRRQGLILWNEGYIRLPEPEALALMAHYELRTRTSS